MALDEDTRWLKEPEELDSSKTRRQRFLEAKKDAGDFYKLQINEIKKDYTVFYDDEGTIISITKEDVVPQQECNSTIFKHDQVEILKGKNINLYRVVQDPDIETVFSIERRPEESLFVRNEDSFVQLIEISNEKDFDLSVSLKDSKLKLTLGEKILKKYKGKDAKNITAKGHKEVKIYFTSINDPHFLVYFETILLSELVKNKTIVKEIPEGMDQCSLYTIKIFDKYVRT